jgi:hypothetical protein
MRHPDRRAGTANGCREDAGLSCRKHLTRNLAPWMFRAPLAWFRKAASWITHPPLGSQWRSVIGGPWERRAPARHQGTSSTGKKPRSAAYEPGLAPGAPRKDSRAIDAERYLNAIGLAPSASRTLPWRSGHDAPARGDAAPERNPCPVADQDDVPPMRLACPYQRHIPLAMPALRSLNCQWYSSLSASWRQCRYR